jgi:hypothetical protein
VPLLKLLLNEKKGWKNGTFRPYGWRYKTAGKIIGFHKRTHDQSTFEQMSRLSKSSRVVRIIGKEFGKTPATEAFRESHDTQVERRICRGGIGETLSWIIRGSCARKDTNEAKKVQTCRSNSADVWIRACCGGSGKIQHLNKGNKAVSPTPLHSYKEHSLARKVGHLRIQRTVLKTISRTTGKTKP